MTSKQRTLLGVVLFLPLAAILLATFACLPVPVGDPATSKIDDSLTGAWKAVPKENDKDTTAIVTLRPWDEHTWYLQYLVSEKKDGADKYSIVNYKAWTTKLGGATFITCESLDDMDFLAPQPAGEGHHYYFVAKVELKNDILTAAPLSESYSALKDLKDREKIEAVIKANVDDKDMYNDAMTFKKLGKDELDQVNQLRKSANVGIQ